MSLGILLAWLQKLWKDRKSLQNDKKEDIHEPPKLISSMSHSRKKLERKNSLPPSKKFLIFLYFKQKIQAIIESNYQ